MPSIGQVYYNVLDTSSGEYISSGIDIFSNIITAYGATEVTKVGIQATSGTRVVMNETRTIMIGRTAIYDLDDNLLDRGNMLRMNMLLSKLQRKAQRE